MIRGIQQFQLRTVIGNQKNAEDTLNRISKAGFEGIELCSYMIHPMPLVIRALTRMAGMPMGKSGRLNWKNLLDRSGLKVISLHSDIGSVLKRSQEVAAEAHLYHTNYVVITGMHHFDYLDEEAVHQLAQDLNQAGKLMKDQGLSLLYHNHNCEFRRLGDGRMAYEFLMDETDPELVNFEFDSYWATDIGVDPAYWMQKLGHRMKLWHINDRGSKQSGPLASILKVDSCELGRGSMNLLRLLQIAEECGVEAVILESHRNWEGKSPLVSAEISAEFLRKYVR